MTKEHTELSSRWDALDSQKKREGLLSNMSPFGLIEGRQDFRGINVSAMFMIPGKRGEGIEKRNWTHSDFRFSDWNNVSVSSSEFHDVLFDRAIMYCFHDWQNFFEGCRYDQTDFRRAGFGIHTSRYNSCVFRRCKVTEALFHNAVFKQTDFLDCRWGSTDVNTAGFWNCRFTGLFEMLWFHAFPEVMGPYHTPPIEVGLHDVDFSEAEIHWFDTTGDVPMERITLPKDGSLCFIPVSSKQRILEAIGTAPLSAEEKKIFEGAVDFEWKNATAKKRQCIGLTLFGCIKIIGDSTLGTSFFILCSTYAQSV